MTVTARVANTGSVRAGVCGSVPEIRIEDVAVADHRFERLAQGGSGQGFFVEFDEPLGGGVHVDVLGGDAERLAGDTTSDFAPERPFGEASDTSSVDQPGHEETADRSTDRLREVVDVDGVLRRFVGQYRLEIDRLEDLLGHVGREDEIERSFDVFESRIDSGITHYDTTDEGHEDTAVAFECNAVAPRPERIGPGERPQWTNWLAPATTGGIPPDGVRLSDAVHSIRRPRPRTRNDRSSGNGVGWVPIQVRFAVSAVVRDAIGSVARGGSRLMTDSGSDADASVEATTDTRADQENILRVQIREGLSELNRPADGLALSGLSAGLDIGFGPLLMAIVLTVSESANTAPLVEELVLANAYAIGFVFVVLGRSELFTEHTTLAVLPVLDGQANLGQLARLWGIVYGANVVGGAVFAAIVVFVAPGLGVADASAFVEIAKSLTEHRWQIILAAGVLAGWLMGLLSWLVAAAQESVARLLFVWIIATAIGFAHLPHSIAGTVEVLAGVFVAPSLTMLDFARFLVPATVGNAIGGSIFVAVLKYGHVVRGSTVPDGTGTE